MLRMDDMGTVYHIHDFWSHYLPEDNLRPTVCDEPWIGFTDFALPGTEALELFPPMDPASLLSGPPSEDEEEEDDRSPSVSSGGSTRSQSSNEGEAPQEVDHEDRNAWLTCGSTVLESMTEALVCVLREEETSEENEERSRASTWRRPQPQLRMLRREPTDPEWQFIDPDQREERPLPAVPEGQPQEGGARTQGELPGSEGEEPEEYEDPHWEGQWGRQGLEQNVERRWRGPEEEDPLLRREGDRHGLERGYQAGYDEGRWEAFFHFGGNNAPVPLVQQVSTSSGLPSYSEEAPTPVFGSSSNTSGQRTISTGQGSSGTGSTMGVATTLGRDPFSAEGTLEESGATRRETTRSTTSDETSTRTKVTTVVEVAKPTRGTTSQPASSSLDLRQQSGLSASSGTTTRRSGSADRQEPTVVEVSTTVSVMSGGEKMVRQVKKSSKMPVDVTGEAILEGAEEEEETTLENPGAAVVKGGYSAYQVPPLVRRPRTRKEKQTSTEEAGGEAEEMRGQNLLSGLRNAVGTTPRATSSSASSTSVAAGGAHAEARHGETLPPQTLNDRTRPPENPWNAFQHANRGRGWSKQKMQEEYWRQKGSSKGKKP